MKETDLAKALAALIRAPEQLMSHVFVSSGSESIERTYSSTERIYTLKNDDGIPLLTWHEHELNGASIQDAIERKLASLLCAVCETILYDGESGICGPCESKVIMDAIRFKRSLAW